MRGVSLTLDSSGNPALSFYRSDEIKIKVLHCADAACNGLGNTIVTVDPGAQASDHRSTSITLDGARNRVIAYQDSASNSLKVLHCGDSSCTTGNVIATLSSGATVGYQPSIKIDAATGNPIVSFGTFNSMSVAYCGNENCTSGNVITAVDPAILVSDTSLALDASDNPVASYYNMTGKNLKVSHCATKQCQ